MAPVRITVSAPENVDAGVVNTFRGNLAALANVDRNIVRMYRIDVDYTSHDPDVHIILLERANYDQRAMAQLMMVIASHHGTSVAALSDAVPVIYVWQHDFSGGAPPDPSDPRFWEAFPPQSTEPGCPSYEMNNMLSRDETVTVYQNAINEVARRKNVEAEKKKNGNAAFKKVMDFLYDLFTVTLAIVDVVSDILIAITWYQTGQMTFFYIGLSIFIVASLCYAALFTAVYTEDDCKSWYGKPVVVFLYALPFAQAIPVLMWVQSFEFELVNNAFRALKLNPEGLSSEMRTFSATTDPLMTYLQRKLVTHGGFLIESFVEAVPQSIIQMIAIVITGEFTPINVFSISISIVSVASKGIMVSYSVDRPTFVFNFLCICYDVVSVFVTVSYLFFTRPGEELTTTFFGFKTNPLSTHWFNKELILLVVFALFGLGAFFGGPFYHTILRPLLPSRNQNRQRKVKANDVAMCLLCLIFGTLVFLPFMVALEGVKFSLIPLVVFQSLDDYEHFSNPLVYRRFVAWCRGSIHDRLYYTFLCNAWKSSAGFNTSTAVYYITSTPKREFRLSEWMLKAQHSMSLRYQFSEIKKSRQVAQQRRRNRQAAAGIPQQPNPPSQLTTMEKLGRAAEAVGIGYFTCIVIPLTALSALFSLVFPFISFFSTTPSDLGLLQIVLSTMLFAIAFVMLVLLYWVLTFQYIDGMAMGHMPINLAGVNQLIVFAELEKSRNEDHLPPFVPEWAVSRSSRQHLIQRRAEIKARLERGDLPDTGADDGAQRVVATGAIPLDVAPPQFADDGGSSDSGLSDAGPAPQMAGAEARPCPSGSSEDSDRNQPAGPIERAAAQAPPPPPLPPAGWKPSREEAAGKKGKETAEEEEEEEVGGKEDGRRGGEAWGPSVVPIVLPPSSEEDSDVAYAPAARYRKSPKLLDLIFPVDDQDDGEQYSPLRTPTALWQMVVGDASTVPKPARLARGARRDGTAMARPFLTPGPGGSEFPDVAADGDEEAGTATRNRSNTF